VLKQLIAQGLDVESASLVVQALGQDGQEREPELNLVSALPAPLPRSDPEDPPIVGPGGLMRIITIAWVTLVVMVLLFGGHDGPSNSSKPSSIPAVKLVKLKLKRR
jgi:hypothetical protein